MRRSVTWAVWLILAGGLFSTQMGNGIVGDPVLSIEGLARHAGNIAVRLRRGEAAATVQAASQSADRSIYDWRELLRWSSGDAGVFPAGIMLLRQPGVWGQHNVYKVSAALILTLQSALIAGLIVQHVRRRRTELALRASELRFRATVGQNQDLAGRLIKAQEEERTRIARELHDDLGQQLGGLSIMLSSLKRRINKPGADQEIDRVVTTLQDRAVQLAQSVRSLSHELHPSVLENVGLVATLRRHCVDVEELHHLKVIFSAGDDVGSLTPDITLCLFRVAQEALSNAVRHARARTISVQLMATHEGVELRIVDDGIGFVTSERTRRGLGLRSIDERVRLTNGRVTIESRAGHGTNLLVRIPPMASQVELVRHS